MPVERAAASLTSGPDPRAANRTQTPAGARAIAASARPASSPAPLCWRHDSAFGRWTVRLKVAILIAMSVSEQMPLADVKNRLSEVVDRLEREHGRIVITKHGHPAVVVMSVADLESLEETLDIMDSAELLSDIRQSLADVACGAAEVLRKDQAQQLISRR